MTEMYKNVHLTNCLTYQGSEHKNNADDHEGLDGSEPVRPGDVAGDAVEDIDEDEEDCDEDGHPPGDALRGHEEADPGHDDEHPGGEVVGNDVVSHLSPKLHLKTRDRVIS